MSSLLVLGAGGHGRVTAEAAATRFTNIAFLDDSPVKTAADRWQILGPVAESLTYKDEYPQAVVAIGDNKLRLALIDRLAAEGFQVVTVVHPSAVVSPSATIEAGCVILAHAVVSVAAHLGRGCIVNTSSTIDHDCELGEGVHVSPGGHLAGNVSVGARTWIGIGAVVRERVNIGSDAIIGAGAAVVADVADGKTVLGVPAKSL